MIQDKEMCVVINEKKGILTKDKKIMCLNVMVKNTEKKPLSIEDTINYFRREYKNTDEERKMGRRDVLCNTNEKKTNNLSFSNGNKFDMGSGNTFYDNDYIVLKEFMYNADGFVTSYDGKLFYQELEVMNCVVKINNIVSSTKKVLYKCSIYIQGRIVNQTIPGKEFLNGSWLQSRIPGFATGCEKNQALQLIYKYLNGLVRKVGLETVRNLEKKPGWTKYNGRMVYITPNGIIPSGDKSIISEYGQKFGPFEKGVIGDIHLFLKMLNLTPSTWIAPVIILYTVMSFSYSLFKEANIVPKFLLFVNGPRGSYKTSIALLMTQIEQVGSPEYSLKSSSAGIETGYKKYKDAVMLIDDLAPTQEVRERKKLQNNLELVVRAFGDANGVKRNYDFIDSSVDVEQYKAEGGAIITGEYTSGCESSLARCLFLPLQKGEVNVNLMSELQSETGILAAFFAGYIDYITKNYHKIVAFIDKRCRGLRREFVNKYSNERYGEYQAQLIVTAEILLSRYGCETYQLGQIEVEQFLTYFKNCIYQAIEYNDGSLIEEAPIVLLCRAIVTQLELKKIPIIPRNEKIDTATRCVLETETVYYIRAEDIYMMKKAYDSENGILSAEYKAAGLANLLCDSGIAQRFHEGKTVRTGKKIGRFRYLEINKQKLVEAAKL